MSAISNFITAKVYISKSIMADTGWALLAGLILLLILLIIFLIIVGLIFFSIYRGGNSYKYGLFIMGVVGILLLILAFVYLVFVNVNTTTEPAKKLRVQSRELSNRIINLERSLSEDPQLQTMLMEATSREPYIDVSKDMSDISVSSSGQSQVKAILLEIKSNNEKIGDYYSTIFGGRAGSELVSLLDRRSQLLYDYYCVVYEVANKPNICLDEVQANLETNCLELATLINGSKKISPRRPTFRYRNPEANEILAPCKDTIDRGLKKYVSSLCKQSRERLNTRYDRALACVKEAKVVNQHIIQLVVGYCWNLYKY